MDNYNTLEVYKTDSYEVVPLPKYRTKERFSVLGLTWSCDDIVWTGILWGKAKLLQQKVKTRSLDYNTGWGAPFWCEWEEEWNHNSVLKD